MRRRQRGPDRLGRVLERSLEGRRLGAVLVEGAIAARWEEAVGPQVAARARPDGLRDGVLTVRAASAPWAAELAFRKPVLLDRINAAAGAPEGRPVVADLRFVTGTLPPAPPRPETPRPAEPLTPEQGRLIESITREVADGLLREAIARALARAVARGPLPEDDPAGRRS